MNRDNTDICVLRLARAQRGLQDVLFSKIGKSQRDPAIMLVASVIEVSDFVWCLTEDSETHEKGKFFLIVVNLVRQFGCTYVLMIFDQFIYLSKNGPILPVTTSDYPPFSLVFQSAISTAIWQFSIP